MWKSNFRRLLLEKSAREDRVIPQREVAEITGVEENTIGRWMTDTPMSQIKARTVTALSEFLGCDWQELVTLQADEDPENETRSTPNAA